MEKLIKIQNELKVPKNSFNEFGGYSYRSCEDILEAVKPLLLKYSCNLIIKDDIIEVGGRVYVKATATFFDEKNEITVPGYARESETKKKMDDSQITGATSSYARKRALGGLFLIDDTKDADATNKHEEELDKQPKKQKNEVLEWMSEKTFNELKTKLEKAELVFDIEDIASEIKKWTEAPKGMKRDFREQLMNIYKSKTN